MKKMTGRLLSISAALLLLTNSVTAFAEQGSSNIVSAASMPESAQSAQAGSGGSASEGTTEKKSAPIIMNQGVRQNSFELGLGGATVTMIKGKESGQQLAIVVKSNDGRIIVVDGGFKTNAPYLGEYIKANGGKVAVWLLTHPHVDHVGALDVMLEQQKSGNPKDFAKIDLGEIYYSFAPMDFYKAHEQEYRLPVIQESYDDIAAYDQSKVHYNSPAGTSFDIGNVNVQILNQPYLFDIDTGNNSSICYMLTINGKKILITGDLPYEAAEQLLKDRGAAALKADVVQLAHHGQHGGSFAFYSAVGAKYALWPTPQSLWDKRDEAFTEDQQTYTIALTRHWMNKLSVEQNFVMADGDWTFR